MNKILKFNTASARIGFTSDLHLNHGKLYAERGFESLAAMNDAIIASLQNFDVIISGGDMTLNTTEEDLDGFLPRIPATIYTLWGNHPNPLWKIYKREVLARYHEEVEVYPFKWRNLIFMGNYAEFLIDKRAVILSHYAIRSWNHLKYDSFMLHGHEHGAMPESLPANNTSGKILDIGWDVHKRALTFQEIEEIMSQKPRVFIGHH